jgi:predicted phosphodiesterase
MSQRLSDEEFKQAFRTLGATELSVRYGVTERNVYKRRSALEARYHQSINAPSKMPGKDYPGRVPISVRNGTVLIGSDLHIWPGAESTAMRAFKKFIDDMRPAAVILNGDVLDFASISRHPMSWESIPTVQQEIEAAQDHLNDLVKVCRKARKIWTLGNHDARLELKLANVAPEFKGVKGIHLHDHFALWERAWSCRINENEPGDTMVKHRLGGGKHAPLNNILKAGTSIVTGHLHNQQVRTHSDYRPYDLYGMDTGCIADKDHSAFLYTESNPLDWRSGFGICTYVEGRLLPPELVTKWDEKTVVFRGQLMRVSHAQASSDQAKAQVLPRKQSRVR